VEMANRVLAFGGLGHTAVIHSGNDKAIREYGLKIRASRVVVNSPAPHGSVGLSTRLFPAMTLGCGALGNNSTSDNIGPQHLMNIKRVAAEMKPVEGLLKPLPAPTARQVIAPAMAAPVAPVAAAPSSVDVPERQVIARVVERFLQQKGVSPIEATNPSARAAAVPLPVVATPPPPPPIKAAEFVSETDVRAAVGRGEKIYLSDRTILTPSARDLGEEHGIFVETT
jgi:hypothetical protein